MTVRKVPGNFHGIEKSLGATSRVSDEVKLVFEKTSLKLVFFAILPSFFQETVEQSAS